MKVTGTRLERLVLRTRGETTDASGIDCVLVSIITDDGLIGYGEAIPGFEYTGETADTVQSTIDSRLGPSILGRGPSDIEAIVAGWRTTIDGHQAARAAVEMALWDLRGKAEGRPLYDLLGGRTRRSVPETYPFDRVERAEQAFERARALRAEGIRVFKVYLTVGDPPVLDPLREAIVEAVRAGAGPDVEIRVDANGGWPDVDTAVAAIRRLERSAISRIEEPVRDRDLVACRAIRARTSTPVCLDESVLGLADARAAIDAEACDIISVKLMKTGGIVEALEVDAIAEAAGVATHIGNMGHSTVGVAAILHLHAALANAWTSDVDPPIRGGDLAADIASGPVEGVEDGSRVWAPSSRSGLGIELIPDAIADQRTSPNVDPGSPDRPDAR
jgi:L-alanine-DL-glutamate epimerase-like enolase superfamily enzyme